jgi:hypothetical protein
MEAKKSEVSEMTVLKGLYWGEIIRTISELIRSISGKSAEPRRVNVFAAVFGISRDFLGLQVLTERALRE